MTVRGVLKFRACYNN